MKTYQCALVGSHFRPPAKLVLALLPGGTPLRLEAEPDNPYDPDAVRVFVSPQAIPEEAHEELALALPGAGFDLQELLAGEDIWLGFLGRAAKLIEAGQVDNQQAARDLEARREVQAALTFSISGKPSVLVKVGGETRLSTQPGSLPGFC